MSTLLIEGGHRLQGRVAVEGNKNAALPLLAACLLTEDECVLRNVPRIGDVDVMARLLLDLGAAVDGIGSTTLRVRAPRLSHSRPRARRTAERLRPPLCPCWRVARATSRHPEENFRRGVVSTHRTPAAVGGQQRVVTTIMEAPDGMKGASCSYEAFGTGTETGSWRRLAPDG